MRIARSIGIAVLAAVLVAAAVAITGGPAESADVMTQPRFFEFPAASDGGVNRFLVRIDAETRVDDGPLSWEGDTIELDSATDDLIVTPEELEGRGGEGRAIDVLRAMPETVALLDLGFGTFSLATSLHLQQVSELPGVLRVDVDPRLEVASADEFFPYQWPLENSGQLPDGSSVVAGADISVYDAWHRTRGAGIVVAVVDSGIDTTHPDLALNIWSNPGETCDNGTDDDGNGFVDDCHGWDFVNSDGTVEDLIGHGTHIAGIIAAQSDNLTGIAGVAPDATIMPVKIADAAPLLSDAILGIDYAIKNGAQIINASWVSSDPAAAEYLRPVIEAAEDAGVLVIAGAGNFGEDLDRNPLYPAALDSPNVISVGASTAEDKPAGYSNYGAESVDVFAPGDGILSTYPGGGYGVFSGTSMAAPMVSGVAALLWSATPGAQAAEVKSAILDRSDGPNDGVDSFAGLAVSSGRLNASSAIFSRLFEAEVVYWFHDFDSFVFDAEHDVSVRVLLNDSEDMPPVTELRYRVTLAAPQNGAVVSVVGQEIRTGPFVAVTDETGRAYLGDEFERQHVQDLLGDGDVAEFAMTLPVGSYALLIETLLDGEEPTRIGNPAVVFFGVGTADRPPLPISPFPDLQPIPPDDDEPAATEVIAPEAPTVPDDDSVTEGSEDEEPQSGEVAGPSDEVVTDPSPEEGPEVAAFPGDDPDGLESVVPETETLNEEDTSSDLAKEAESVDGEDGPIPPTGEAVQEEQPDPDSPGQEETRAELTEPEVAEAEDPAPFVISAINPTSGPAAGGNEVSIVGEDIPDGTKVLFGDRQATILSNGAPEFLSVKVPLAPAGAVAVAVVDLETGTSVAAGTYTYLAGDEPVSEPLPMTPSTTTTTTIASETPTDTQPVGDPSLGGLKEWLASALVTPEGVEFGELDSNSPLRTWPLEAWPGGKCVAAKCRGWEL